MSKITTATRKKLFLEAIGKGAKVKEACLALEIDQSLPYHWKKSDSHFRTAWQEVRATRWEMIHDVTQEIALDGDKQVLMFLYDRYLRQKEKDEASKETVAGEIIIHMPDPEGKAHDFIEIS